MGRKQSVYANRRLRLQGGRVVAVTAPVALGGSLVTLATAGAVVLGVLLILAAGLGVFAAFRTGRTNALLGEFKSIAETAESTAATWKNRSEATQAELDALARRTADDKRRADEALATAVQKIADLQSEVAHLGGIVTARQQILDLGVALAAMHERTHQEHQQILALLKGETSGRTGAGPRGRRRSAPAPGDPAEPVGGVGDPGR